MASHMDGINSLPRWDPSNPTTYNYDWRTYDAADYQKFKQARLDFIAKRDAGKPTLAEAMKNLSRTIKQTIGDQVAKENNKKTGLTKQSLRQRLARGAVISAATPSSCFESLSAETSGGDMVLVTATFANPTRGDWYYEMTLDEFLDWANDDLGVAFNEWVRGNYEV